MKYPNAANGVKKIFTAEIVKLIAEFCYLGAGVAAIPAAIAIDSGAVIGTFTASLIMMIFLTAAVTLSVISFVMNFVGIRNAAEDEAGFQGALFFLVLSILTYVIGVTVGTLFHATLAANLLFSASEILKIFVTILIISGIVKLADRNNRGDISAKGTSIFKIFIAIGAAVIIGRILVAILGGDSDSIISGSIAVFAAVMSIIEYVMYLNLLANAKKMLNEK